MSSLSDRAMLASLSIKSWSARRLDRVVTEETNARHGVAADAGRYNKLLIPADALAAVVSAHNAARTEHYRLTLAWGDDGSRILPSKMFLTYTAAMRDHRAAVETAVAEFLAAYPAHVSAARVRLNGMFDAADYPSPAEIESKFGFRVHINPVPSGDDFRVDVGDDAAAAIRADIESRATDAMREAMREVWERVAETVGHMVTKLTAERKNKKGETAPAIFRDSLVENVRTLVDILPALNVGDDATLASIADRMRAELCGHDAADLRDSDALRTDTAKAAAAILADVSAYLA